MNPIDHNSPAAGRSRRFRLPRRSLGNLLRAAVLLLAVWLVVAYLLLPMAWRDVSKRHPAIEAAPRITLTANGIHGDPLNVGLVGNEEGITTAMLAAKWYPADPLTLRSCLRIAADTVLRRSYSDAPVSNLFLWGRKEDLAFEQPVGDDPRRRHHVRFWRSEQVDDQGLPLWLGATTFDTKVGFSHTTGQITHHIDADVDVERDKLMNDLERSGHLAATYWVDGFQDHLQGHNGGGDPYHTDGRLAVGVIHVEAHP